MPDEDKNAEIARLEAELARVRSLSIVPAADESTALVYWIDTMRGLQPRCRKCDTSLTRGPKGGVIESECPSCHMELRNASPSVESR